MTVAIIGMDSIRVEADFETFVIVLGIDLFGFRFDFSAVTIVKFILRVLGVVQTCTISGLCTLIGLGLAGVG